MSKQRVPGNRVFFPDDPPEYPNIHLKKEDMQRYHARFGFTEEQIREFLEAFSVFDKDSDTFISQMELCNVMVALGHRPTQNELETLIRGIDDDHHGRVSFEKFLMMMATKISHDPESELREVFDVFDSNGDGLITADELYEILTRLGEDITKDEAKEMIKEADTNDDGAVDYKEFKAILIAK